MNYFKELVESGKNNIKGKTVIICGIVRDCGSELKKNIKSIEKIGHYFKDYQVIVFENNSKDNTKEVLTNWSKQNNKVISFTNDFDETKYQSIPLRHDYNFSNSKRRISKMIDYRNLYMNYIEENKLYADYLFVVDLDVSSIDVDGVLTSFGVRQSWDAIVANSKSISPKFRVRYHDTYALTEFGYDKIPQTEYMIDSNRYIWSSLKKNMPIIKIFSGYGGVAIYNWHAVSQLKYKLVDNNYGGVEVRCEHYSIYSQMVENGHDNVYINPNMIVAYQRLNFRFVVIKLKEKFKNKNA